MVDTGSGATREAGVFDRQGRRKYLNASERRAFYETVKREKETERRAFCLTLFYTGCRISEALNLTAGRVDLSQRALVFETLKRREKGMFRAVPVPDSLIVLLRGTNADSETSERVWSFSRATGYRLVKAQMAKARIKGAMASPKGLRHSFAVACISKNIPLTTVQKWLGHAKLETTAIYLNVSGEDERKLARRLWSNR